MKPLLADTLETFQIVHLIKVCKIMQCNLSTINIQRFLYTTSVTKFEDVKRPTNSGEIAVTEKRLNTGAKYEQ